MTNEVKIAISSITDGTIRAAATKVSSDEWLDSDELTSLQNEINNKDYDHTEFAQILAKFDEAEPQNTAEKKETDPAKIGELSKKMKKIKEALQPGLDQKQKELKKELNKTFQWRFLLEYFGTYHR